MSLAHAKIWPVVKRLYLYKLRANSRLILLLTISQIAALNLALVGLKVDNSSWSNQLTYYSATANLLAALAWAFLASFFLTLNPVRNLDFAFVTNRLSSTLADIAYLVTGSILGGLIATLSGVLLRNLLLLFGRGPDIIGTNFYLPPRILLLTGLTAIMYLLLVSALGYLLGTIAQLNKVLLAVVPAVTLAIMAREILFPFSRQFEVVAVFILLAPSYPIFIIKNLLVSILLLITAILIYQRKEVRQ